MLVLDGAAAAARLLGGLALTEAGLAEAGDTELGGTQPICNLLLLCARVESNNWRCDVAWFFTRRA